MNEYFLKEFQINKNAPFWVYSFWRLRIKKLSKSIEFVVIFVKLWSVLWHDLLRFCKMFINSDSFKIGA